MEREKIVVIGGGFAGLKRLRLLLRPTKYPLRRHWGD